MNLLTVYINSGLKKTIQQLSGEMNGLSFLIKKIERGVLLPGATAEAATSVIKLILAANNAKDLAALSAYVQREHTIKLVLGKEVTEVEVVKIELV